MTTELLDKARAIVQLHSVTALQTTESDIDHTLSGFKSVEMDIEKTVNKLCSMHIA